MTLRSLFLSPLGPALILALGGAMIMLVRRLTYRIVLRLGQFGLPISYTSVPRPALIHLRVPVVALVLGLAAGALALLRGATPDALVRWDWQPLTVAGSALVWRLDGWSWLVCGLILALTGVALLLAPSRWVDVSEQRSKPTAARMRHLDRRDVEWERTLWLAAAALIFVCSDNVLTLAASWILLDAALALCLRPTESPNLAGRAWGSLSLAALLLVLALTVLGETGIRTTLTDPRMDRLVLALLWLLALIRAGVYPFHFWLGGKMHVERSAMVALALLAPLAGVWLLVRLHGIAGPDWLRRPEWAALGALALLGTGLVAWAAEDESQRWRWIALNRASMVVMAAYTAGSSGAEALVWPALTFALGGALLAVAQALQGYGSRAPAWLAGLMLWGIPGATGFVARTALVFPTELPVAVPLFGLVLLAEILLAAALWQAASARVPAQPGGAGRRVVLMIAFALLLAGSLIFGLGPWLLAVFVGWPAGEAFPTLATLFAGARRSVWAGLVVSGGLGAALGLTRRQLFGQMRGWQRGIMSIASLEWFYQTAAVGYRVAAGGLRYFAALGEGEGYLGWLALGSLLLWVLLRG